MMLPSNKCIALIKEFEGYKDKAYKCPAGIWTIGYGSTMYSDGTRVKEGDKVSKETAEATLMWELTNKSKSLVNLRVNQNKFDALMSFAYNLGIGALLDSTLYKKVRMNPYDITIRDEFLRWNKARVNGKLTVLPGLTRRRDAEANLYFTEI